MYRSSPSAKKSMVVCAESIVKLPLPSPSSEYDSFPCLPSSAEAVSAVIGAILPFSERYRRCAAFKV